MEADVTPAAGLIGCRVMGDSKVLIVVSGDAGTCCTEGQSDEAEHEEVNDVLFNFHTISIMGLGGN